MANGVWRSDWHQVCPDKYQPVFAATTAKCSIARQPIIVSVILTDAKEPPRFRLLFIFEYVIGEPQSPRVDDDQFVDGEC